MDYLERIRRYYNDPMELEALYQSARKTREVTTFRTAVITCREESPDNVLYAAWYHRMQGNAGEVAAAEGRVNWASALPLSMVCGLIFAALAYFDSSAIGRPPLLFLLCGPISAAFIIAFLALAGKLERRRILIVIAVLAAITAYALVFAISASGRGYEILMLLHLPALAWIAIGAVLVGPGAGPAERFAFLAKSLEVLITGGLYVIVGGIMAGITMGLFEALGVHIPEELFITLIAGGGGLIPVLAVAAVYDPRLAPTLQRFDQGLSKLIATLMRLVLPPTLLVLAVYLFVIPFNFMEPFHNRDLLIVYNVMLFAVMGLLIGATPVSADGLSEKQQSVLRAGILALAGLTVLISLYAMSAVVYRTAVGGITMNRLTVIGWNGLNIGILALLIYRLVKSGRAAWLPALHSAFSTGTMGYVVWTVFIVVSVPVLL